MTKVSIVFFAHGLKLESSSVTQTQNDAIMYTYIYSNPKKDRKVSSYFNVLKLLFYLFGGDNIAIYSQSSAGIPHPGWTNSYDWHIEPQLASNVSGTFFVNPSNHASGPIHINTWMHLRILVNQNRPGQGFEHHFPLIFFGHKLRSHHVVSPSKIGSVSFFTHPVGPRHSSSGKRYRPGVFFKFSQLLEPRGKSRPTGRFRPFLGSQMTQPECYTF
jgi:hypothetical protein